nr:carboxymuconolactone decarboxylase family protein [Rhodococcus sp. 114MFTsu3.1]
MLASEIERGLDRGLETAEISEIITHLAFYASWPNALAAVEAARPVFEGRGGRSRATFRDRCRTTCAGSHR